MKTGAHFSDCLRYRYRLWRIWELSKPMQMWLMLNPSTADHVDNDPTVERCQRRAKACGFGGVMVGNIFALRSTDPRGIKGVADPIGPYNDQHLRLMAELCRKQGGQIICGWGTHGAYLDRGRQVATALRDAGHTLYALRVTKAGMPGHPLYVAYKLQPQVWEGA